MRRALTLGFNPAVKRILVIEDEPKTAQFIRQGLSESGYAVECAQDGLEGLHRAREHRFDCIILDVMLPGLDGWGVLAALRTQQDTPVIFLTANAALDSRIRGLKMGADDYLGKPFSFTELLERVRAVTRRGQGIEREGVARIADLELDLARASARRAGRSFALTAQEFKLLAVFVREQDKVLSRAYLAEHVWGIDFDTDTNIVDVAVRRLRAKVDDEHELKLIRTVRGMGYCCSERSMDSAT
jgi:two-component system, OmpR family, copper resistance phosphate regulon response regulator CusR